MQQMDREDKKRLNALQEAIGYTFHDSAVMQLALTHPSMSPHHNQRLEFLGDAVLDLCVSERIYAMHPGMQEGAMTRLRQKLVREENLAGIARKIRLGEAIYMDWGCVQNGGRENPSVLCDAFEALLAAVYLDGGMEEARKVVLRLIGNCSDTGVNDAKSALQEYLQGHGLTMPCYHTVNEEGPPHERVFTVSVFIGGQEAARGTGTSKKRAEQEAAGKALEKMIRSGE